MGCGDFVPVRCRCAACAANPALSVGRSPDIRAAGLGASAQMTMEHRIKSGISRFVGINTPDETRMITETFLFMETLAALGDT
jgi:hypothetical protein